ncbi:unnamed protein product [Chrysoparadoxa australica]
MPPALPLLPPERRNGGRGSNGNPGRLTGFELMSSYPGLLIEAALGRVRGTWAKVEGALSRLPLGPLVPFAPHLVLVVRMLGALMLAGLVLRLSISLKKRSVGALVKSEGVNYLSGTHKWSEPKDQRLLFGGLDPHYCNVCGEVAVGLMQSPLVCELCGCHAHVRCVKKAPAQGLACKHFSRADVERAAQEERLLVNGLMGDRRSARQRHKGGWLSLSREQDPADASAVGAMGHQWIKGNIEAVSKCAVCGKFCGSDGLGLHGHSCVWCDIKVHDGCLAAMRGRQCNMGRHRKLLLPPVAVTKDSEHEEDEVSMRQKLKAALRSVLPGKEGGDALLAPLTPEEEAWARGMYLTMPTGTVQEIAMMGLKNETEAEPSTVGRLKAALRSVMLDQEREGEEDALEGGLEGWDMKVAEFHHEAANDTSSKLVRRTRMAHLNISTESIAENATPLLVFVNGRSGGKQGQDLLSSFRRRLHPLQVVDLSEDDPVHILRRFSHVPRLRLLCCGGDGTVSWLLQAVDSVDWPDRPPPMAIAPLGTGNDMARVLGWGPGYTAGDDLDELLEKVGNARITMLDRWSVNVSTTKRPTGRILPMNNYMGVGVDGQVALEFHAIREARPGLFFNRVVNKAVYAGSAARNIIVRSCQDLGEKLTLTCDGVDIPLPARTESIIILNINSYGGGSKLWILEEEDGVSGIGPRSLGPATLWGFGLGRGAFQEEKEAEQGGEAGSEEDLWDEDLGVEAGEESQYSEHGSEGESSSCSDSDNYSDSASDSYDSSSGEESQGPLSGFWSGLGFGRRRRPVFSPLSISDGVLEVVAVEGALHLGQIRVGMAQARTVAQCRSLQIKTNATLPMQVDGEPWRQKACNIDLTLHSQAFMLRPATREEGAVANALNSWEGVLAGAQERGIISQDQVRQLQRQLQQLS